MKLNFKKSILIVIFLVFVINILSGCGKNNVQQDSKIKKPIKIIWWTHQRHDMDYMNSMVEKFNKENKDNIIIEYYVHTEDYEQSLDFAFQSQDAPDIFSMLLNAKYYADRNMAEPLDQWVTPKLKKSMGEGNFQENISVVDGKVYSLPNGGITYRLVYNKDIFKMAGITKVPENMDEVLNAAKIITQKGKDKGIYGFAMDLKDPYMSLNRSLDQVAKRSGILPYNYKTGNYDFTVMKPVVQSFKALVDEKVLFPRCDELNIDPLRSQFAKGKIGMYISGQWEAGVYSDQFRTSIDWAAAPVPYVGNKANGVSEILGGKWQAISKQSKNKEAAWKVLQFFYSDEVLVPYHEKGLGMTIIPDIAKIAKQSSVKGTDFFLVNNHVDGRWPTTPDTTSLKIEGKSYYDEFAEVILRNKDFDNVAKALNDRYNIALDKAVKEKKEKKYQLSNFDPSTLIK